VGEFAPAHLIILLAVVLLVFGSKRLPEIARGVGQGMREFKDSIAGTGSDAVPEAPPAPPPAPALGQPERPASTPSEPAVDPSGTNSNPIGPV
jgi:sec-independent protein translocase protein TatA